MLILEHFSPVFKLLDKTLEIWWLLPSLIKINKKLVADFVKGFFLVFFFSPLIWTETTQNQSSSCTQNVYLAF